MYLPGFSKRTFRAALVSASAMLFSACGGGGGDNYNDANASTAVPPVRSQTFQPIATESTPQGAVVDISALKLLPLSPGDSWLYDVTDAAGNAVGVGTRAVAVDGFASDALSARGNLVEIEQGTDAPNVMAFAKQNDGVHIDYSLDGALPPQAAKQIGLVREYAMPAYAIGETRTVIREGLWDQDVDGDGSPERFRLEYTQTFRGMEQFSLPWGAADVAIFSNAYRFVVTTSTSNESRGVVTTEEAYLAAELGPVKFVRRAADLQGNEVKSRIWTIKSLTVDGKTFSAPV